MRANILKILLYSFVFIENFLTPGIAGAAQIPFLVSPMAFMTFEKGAGIVDTSPVSRSVDPGKSCKGCSKSCIFF